MRLLLLILLPISLIAKGYVAKDFSYLTSMKGFSSSLIEMHLKLYGGYVKNSNFLLEALKTPANDYEYGALKRRLGWELDGMRLHELYFENLGGDGKPNSKSMLIEEISRQFAGFQEWKRGFRDTGLIRGIGWVVLYLDPETGRLINLWINEHDVGHLAGGVPLIVMDVWEHAYITQFGLDRAAYIRTFFAHLDWKVAEERYLSATQASKRP